MQRNIYEPFPQLDLKWTKDASSQLRGITINKNRRAFIPINLKTEK